MRRRLFVFPDLMAGRVFLAFRMPLGAVRSRLPTAMPPDFPDFPRHRFQE